MRPSKIPSIRCIDTKQYGLARRGAAYLIVGKRSGLVETGTPRAAPLLIEALQGLDLAYIFVTHVHLDHAGSAGALAAANPSSTIVAHPRALKHLADPRRLIEGVRQASPDLFPLYGAPTPASERQLQATEDAQVVDLGRGVLVEVVHAPGHAPHHACFFEHASRTLFVGDAAGYHGVPMDVPMTVPPRFDLDAASATLKRLRALRPSALAFTHFGLTTNHPQEILDRYERQLEPWFDRIRDLQRGRSSDEVISEILTAPKYAGLAAPDRFSIEMCVRGALLSITSDDEARSETGTMSGASPT